MGLTILVTEGYGKVSSVGSAVTRQLGARVLPELTSLEPLCDSLGQLRHSHLVAGVSSDLGLSDGMPFDDTTASVVSEMLGQSVRHFLPYRDQLSPHDNDTVCEEGEGQLRREVGHGHEDSQAPRSATPYSMEARAAVSVSRIRLAMLRTLGCPECQSEGPKALGEALTRRALQSAVPQ